MPVLELYLPSSGEGGFSKALSWIKLLFLSFTSNGIPREGGPLLDSLIREKSHTHTARLAILECHCPKQLSPSPQPCVILLGGPYHQSALERHQRTRMWSNCWCVTHRTQSCLIHQRCTMSTYWWNNEDLWIAKKGNPMSGIQRNCYIHWYMQEAWSWTTRGISCSESQALDEAPPASQQVPPTVTLLLWLLAWPEC